MSVKVDLTFVDENDFQKRGKWFFWSDNSSWETRSTISMETNESLADVSELNWERESETNSEGDSSLHDDGDVSNQQSDDDHTEEASTSFGNRKKKEIPRKQKWVLRPKTEDVQKVKVWERPRQTTRTTTRKESRDKHAGKQKERGSP